MTFRKPSPRLIALLLLLTTTHRTAFAAVPVRKDVAYFDATNHWGEFVEADAPFFSSVLDAGPSPGNTGMTNNLTPRGLILNLGHECWACFDVDLLRVSAIWHGSGPGVTPVSMSQVSWQSAGTKAPEGQENLPRPVGNLWLGNGIYPGWQAGAEPSFIDPRPAGPDPREVGRGPLAPERGRFHAVRLVRGGGALLEYEAQGTVIQEWISARLADGRAVVERRFRLDKVDRDLWLALGQQAPNDEAQRLGVNVPSVSSASSAQATTLRFNSVWFVRVPKSTAPFSFAVELGQELPGGFKVASSAPSSTPPSARWLRSVTTRVVPSTRNDAYVTDNIPLPVDNPWHRNVRLADLAFQPDGRAFAVSFDGDVWMISGLSGKSGEVIWRRYASGFHEPLGICVRSGALYVHDRNGIWRLKDTNGDGEADVHELFSNVFAQTAETREFAAGIRVAPDGSFVIAKGGQQGTTIGRNNGSILRVAADGRSYEVLAHGLRQPFMGVNPRTGLVTASDQEGHYVPTTPLYVVTKDEYHGYIPLILPKEKYPEPIADPLLWIPHAINASAASQVWLESAKMGALNGALIHIAYYRPELFQVLLNHRGPNPQAAVVSVTRDFEFSPLAAAVNPADGFLYVTGFQIFGTTAPQISGLARVRPGGPVCTLPVEVAAMEQGILLRFGVALDRKPAEDASNYSVERWNYVRTANYGSPHFKPDGSKGQEAMVVDRATVSSDGRGVFLGIRGMTPVMQMRLGWSLSTATGADFAQNAYLTPSVLAKFDPALEGFDPLVTNAPLPSSPAHAAAAVRTRISADEGRRVAELMGCAACHSVDGSLLGKVGPTWKGLYGSNRFFADGSDATADEAYLKESILKPSAHVVRGFEKSDTGMPPYEGVVSDAQIESLILYIKSLR